MHELKVNSQNLAALFKRMSHKVDNGHHLVVTVQIDDFGNWDMSRLWRKWMTVTHAYLSAQKMRVPLNFDSNGEVTNETRPVEKQDVHEMFTTRWLGTDQYGTRLTWSKKDFNGMRAATAGERFHALRMHEEWAFNNGVSLEKPRGCEYMLMESAQYV